MAEESEVIKSFKDMAICDQLVEACDSLGSSEIQNEVASMYSTVDTLKQQFLFIPAISKECYLVYILTEMSGSTSMVFTRTSDSVRLLALILQNLGLRAVPVSGKMSQSKRLGALNKFKAGEYNILICTDVASRELDIPSVDLVVNYNIPTNSKNYIHRLGRTARAGRSGVAIFLVNQYELKWYARIEKANNYHSILFKKKKFWYCLSVSPKPKEYQ